MANENNSMTLFFQVFKFNEKFSSFLWSKNSCRFVKNKDFSTTNECFNDFYLLFVTNWQVFNFCASVNFQIVFITCFFSNSYSFFEVEHTAFFRFHAQYYVFSNCKGWHEHKVLVYHTYAVSDSIERTIEPNFLTFQYDSTFFKRFDTEEDFHQCRFACTVFTHQCMNFAFIDGESNIFVSNKAVWVNFCYLIHKQNFFWHIPHLTKY